jgi:formamidopyrimidine-DNA glycosylase
MPELPDLEAYRINLERLILQQRIIAATVYKPNRVTGAPEKFDELASSKIVAVKRYGKEIMLEFDNGRSLAIHLMLQGRIDVVPEEEEVRHKILALKFPDRALVVSDPRGWAKVRLDPERLEAPDALAPDFSLNYFRGKLKEAKAKSIKAVLMDQDIVRGIGNAYSDEILWEARIDPASIASHLPEEVVAPLYEAIRQVLLRSVEEILDIDPKVINGEIRDFMRVHHKEKKTSPNGFPIKTKKIATRKSYFTDEQVLYR